ncbi:MAG: hypothetical protein ACRD5L_03120 [Bryobacteraceae bacterium]
MGTANPMGNPAGVPLNAGVTHSVICAIRGPIMLITIGALGAIDHFGPYSFTQTWPAIIIVFGLLKLAEKLGGPRT